MSALQIYATRTKPTTKQKTVTCESEWMLDGDSIRSHTRLTVLMLFYRYATQCHSKWKTYTSYAVSIYFNCELKRVKSPPIPALNKSNNCERFHRNSNRRKRVEHRTLSISLCVRVPLCVVWHHTVINLFVNKCFGYKVNERSVHIFVTSMKFDECMCFFCTFAHGFWHNNLLRLKNNINIEWHYAFYTHWNSVVTKK